MADAATADVQIAGIHDADLQQAETVAAAFGVPAMPGALDLMQRVDALFVAAPTMDHFVLAREAIRQGVHVFLEWPPATSVTESEKLARVAEEAGVEIGVSRTLRFHPALRDLPPVRAGILMLHREAGSLRLGTTWIAVMEVDTASLSPYALGCGQGAPEVVPGYLGGAVFDTAYARHARDRVHDLVPVL